MLITQEKKGNVDYTLTEEVGSYTTPLFETNAVLDSFNFVPNYSQSAAQNFDTKRGSRSETMREGHP
jgi:hypothetical protein